jgi:hypothetical protein
MTEQSLVSSYQKWSIDFDDWSFALKSPKQKINRKKMMKERRESENSSLPMRSAIAKDPAAFST